MKKNRSIIYGGLVAAIGLWSVFDLFIGRILDPGTSYLNSFERLFAERAGEGGDIDAIKKLYDYFASSKLDKERADYWLEKGAGFGDPEMQYLLGMKLLRSGSTTARGIGFIESSASGGNRYALAWLAERYEDGKYGSKDLKKAVICYREAALSGHGGSASKMATLALEQKDYRAAFAWTLLLSEGTTPRSPFFKEAQEIQREVLLRLNYSGEEVMKFRQQAKQLLIDTRERFGKEPVTCGRD